MSSVLVVSLLLFFFFFAFMLVLFFGGRRVPVSKCPGEGAFFALRMLSSVAANAETVVSAATLEMRTEGERVPRRALGRKSEGAGSDAARITRLELRCCWGGGGGDVELVRGRRRRGERDRDLRSPPTAVVFAAGAPPPTSHFSLAPRRDPFDRSRLPSRSSRSLPSPSV